IAGGTPAHARLQAAVLFALERRLEGRPCQPFPSGLRVKVVATGVATYPDVTVVCGSVETAAEDPRAVTNPTVIAEVLGDSTEAYDRGDKFELIDHAQGGDKIGVTKRAGPGSASWLPLSSQGAAAWHR